MILHPIDGKWLVVTIVALGMVFGCSPEPVEESALLSACHFVDTVPSVPPLYSEYGVDPAFDRLDEVHRMLNRELAAAGYWDAGHTVYLVDIIDTQGRLTANAAPTEVFEIVTIVIYEQGQLTEPTRRSIQSSAREVLLVEITENTVLLRDLVETTMQKGAIPLDVEARSVRPHGSHDFNPLFISGMVSRHSAREYNCIGFERIDRQLDYWSSVGLVYQEGTREYVSIVEYVYDRPSLWQDWGEKMSGVFESVSIRLIGQVAE